MSSSSCAPARPDGEEVRHESAGAASGGLIGRLEDATILIVDDEGVNVRLLERVLGREGYHRLHATTDPTQVLSLYRAHRPDLVLLDLKMPKLDGFGVLEQLSLERADGDFVPVVILTADPSSEARKRALSGGATDFLTKPFNATEVLLRIRNLVHTRQMHLQLRSRNQRLETRVMKQAQQLERAGAELLNRLAQAVEARDFETGRHTQRVGENAARLGHVLGLSGHMVGLLRRAAPLHDVGKVAIPDAILLKGGPLSPDEFEIVKTHTTIGADMLSRGRSKLINLAEQIALCHHERWDGCGYPRALRGEDIPLESRIVAVVDYFDALSHDRPYRAGWPADRVVELIESEAGRHFDPRVAEAFKHLHAAGLVRV